MFERFAVEGQVDAEVKEEVMREISNPKRRHLSMYIKNFHLSDDDVVAGEDKGDEDLDKERKI